MRNGRGDWRSFEPSQESLAPIIGLYLKPPEPHILTADRLASLAT